MKHLSKDSFFLSTVKFPRIMLKDFSTTGGDMPFADCQLKFYIPGETFLFAFYLSTTISLDYDTKDYESRPVIYEISENIRFQPWLWHLFGNQNAYNLISELNDSPFDETRNTTLLKTKVCDMSLEKFMLESKQSLKDYIKNTFGKNFHLFDLKGNKINTSLSKSFIPDTLKNFNHSIDNFLSILNPKTPNNIPTLGPFALSSLHKTCKEIETFRFKHSLENELSDLNVKKNFHKI